VRNNFSWTDFKCCTLGVGFGFVKKIRLLLIGIITRFFLPREPKCLIDNLFRNTAERCVQYCPCGEKNGIVYGEWHSVNTIM